MNDPVRPLDIIDAGPWSSYQKLVLVFCAIVIVLDGIDVLAIGLAAPAIIQEWQVSKSDFAPAIAAGLFGMMIGATTGGILGDRIGRRIAIIVSVFLFGALTLALVLAENVMVLSALRFVAGLGLGSALPNVTALVSEVTPAKNRALGIATVLTCVPIGGALAGFMAGFVLPAYGWRGLFVIAGALPVAVAIILAISLPESPAFLANEESRWPRLRQILSRMDHNLPVNTVFASRIATTGESERHGSIFSPGIRRDTIALWFAFFSCLTATYFCYNWIPTLLAELGHGLSLSSNALTIFNIGGIVAAVGGGWLIARFGSKNTLIALALLGTGTAAFLTMAPGLLVQSLGAATLLFALLGAAVLGLQVLLYSLAAHVYPTPIRATGVGVAAGLGRFGAIVSANLGAFLLAMNGAISFFAAVCACIVATGFGVAAIRRHIPRVTTNVSQIRISPQPHASSNIMQEHLRGSSVDHLLNGDTPNSERIILQAGPYRLASLRTGSPLPVALLRVGERLENQEREGTTMKMDPQMNAVLKQMASSGAPDLGSLDVPQMRELYGQIGTMFGGPEVEMREVQDLSCPGPDGEIPLRRYVSHGAKVGQAPGIIYFHGGGWMVGSIASHDKECRRLAARCDAVVVSVDYRLAPEAPFPAGPEDAIAASHWILANAESLGMNPASISVIGDSAGGSLAAVAALANKDNDGPKLANQILIYPSADLGSPWDHYPSRTAQAETPPLTSEGIAAMLGGFLPDREAGKDWRASPLLARDHTGLPDTLIITAGFDPLRDEGIAYARTLAEAGVQVLHRNFAGMTHGFYEMGGVLDAVAEVDDLVAFWTDRHGV